MHVTSKMCLFTCLAHLVISLGIDLLERQDCEGGQFRMSRTDKSEHFSGSCEKTVPPYSFLLIQKFTPGVIYLRKKFY